MRRRQWGYEARQLFTYVSIELELEIMYEGITMSQF
jgi:hypothetical protein